MDKIILNGCRFYGYHGAFVEEQTLGQVFVVDLELAVDLTRASQSDNLADTVHYGLVFEVVQRQVEEEKYILIERLAGAICEDLFDQFVPIQS
ncbi:dihydroneopterin aldolase, partial [Lactobacillus reuteri]|nr:dihydroneopterin aldolase [Limosilactobacillus reuteri]